MKRRNFLKNISASLALLVIKPWEVFGKVDDSFKDQTVVFYSNPMKEGLTNLHGYMPQAITILKSQKLPGGKLKIWDYSYGNCPLKGMLCIFENGKTGYCIHSATEADGITTVSIIAPTNSSERLY